MALNIVTIDLLIKQCNALEEDTALVQHYGEVAEEMVLSETNRSAEDLLDMGGGEYPARIKQAVLLMAAHFYRVREPVSSVSQVLTPLSYSALVQPFRAYPRDWRDSSETEG